MIETRQLRYFLVLADTLHFGKAADQLHITQPPLTRQIQHLEEQLGVMLFERNKRKVVLTREGEHFREGVQDIFVRLEKLTESTQRIAKGEVGQLRIGFISTANYHTLPPIVRKFRQQYPDIHLTLEEATGDEQQQKLVRGELDIGVMFEDFDSTMSSKILHEESLIAVVPKTDEITGRHLEGKTLAAKPFILFPRARSPNLFDNIMQYCAETGFKPQIAQEARQMQTIVGLVASHLGVSIVPESMKLSGREDVKFLPLSPTTPKVKTYLVWNPQQLPPALNSFLACVDS